MVELNRTMGPIFSYGPGQPVQPGDKTIFVGADIGCVPGKFIHRGKADADHAGRPGACIWQTMGSGAAGLPV